MSPPALSGTEGTVRLLLAFQGRGTLFNSPATLAGIWPYSGGPISLLTVPWSTRGIRRVVDSSLVLDRTASYPLCREVEDVLSLTYSAFSFASVTASQKVFASHSPSLRNILWSWAGHSGRHHLSPPWEHNGAPLKQGRPPLYAPPCPPVWHVIRSTRGM